MGDLLAEADFLRYQGPVPRNLSGIYAALALDEATLIAVPEPEGELRFDIWLQGERETVFFDV